MHARLLIAPALVALVWNCGGSSSADNSPTPDASALDASSRDAATDSPSSSDASNDVALSETGSDVATCVPDAACTTNPGAPCRVGRIACTGTAQCVDVDDAVDGTTCTGGACARGSCLPTTTISADVNLSTTPVAGGRTCAEAPSFAVSAIAANNVTLATAPTGDCLGSGDEVLLINLQGSSAGTTNVGNWEILRVSAVAGSTVTFTTNKTKSYGATAGSDSGVGAGATDQKVALFRVPRFGDLTIASGKTVTADAWDGAKGGVVAMRVGKLTVDGALSASKLGYRSGRWSQDDSDCDDNVATESGESYTGPSVASTANNGGGSGGLGAASNVSFNGNTPISAGSGHATAGEAGKNPNGRTLGTAGAVYGVNDASKLTMGSGTSGNVTCDLNGTAGGALIARFATTAGGVVFLLAGELTVGTSGSITASAADAGRDVSSSGGYVYIKGQKLTLGTDKVSALGGIGESVGGPFSGQQVKSGDGYVVLDAPTISGTTKPAAN